ncbi:MAG: hypothetical protein PHC30_04780 [Lentisphaeria bacterium]|nr:hypothetical protein [Lentisphaeria bacterium]
MAAANRRNLEILLTDLAVPSLSRVKSSGHVVTVDLVWPRPLIALRTAVKTVRFVRGQAVSSPWTWLDRILFKETVEERFGLSVRVSESLTSIRLEGFARYLASSLLGLAADITEDVIPGYDGELAAMPLGYPESQLKKSKEPDLIALGGVDFCPDGLAVGASVDLVIPLRSGRDVTRTTRRHVPRGAPSRREVVLAKDAPDGTATVTLRAF